MEAENASCDLGSSVGPIPSVALLAKAVTVPAQVQGEQKYTPGLGGGTEKSHLKGLGCREETGIPFCS